MATAITLEDVIELATKAHEGQLDKSGEPFIGHPLRVMEAMQNPVDKMVAVLHDVVEDERLTFTDLKKAGMDEVVIAAVDAMTRRKGETYEDYLARAKVNKIARRVKVADIKDNSNPERLIKLPIEQQERLRKKYEAALEFMTK